MIINFNIGLLGHVDSGKTTLARALSTIASTAAFDKNPQSRERGITLDLGFSAVVIDTPVHLQSITAAQKIQFTFVDCPGHASLIRTIMGGAQIIDLIVLVIDAQKGIQTQTAECIIIGELLKKNLIIVLNKIDLIEIERRGSYLERMKTRLRNTFAKTSFANVPIFCISALTGIGIDKFFEGLKYQLDIPERDCDKPLIMYVDHCFPIKGKGTICTGTIIQGKIAVNDMIELPSIKEKRKIKSIQMFKEPVFEAGMGDRVGVCVTQFNADLMERGVIAQPGYLTPVHAAIVKYNPIEYYKAPLKSKSKLHVTIGHETVISKITLFKSAISGGSFDFAEDYEYVDEIIPGDEITTDHFVLLQFGTPILAIQGKTIIAAKLDLDVHSSTCRLVFWGSIDWLTHSSTYENDTLPKLNVYRSKEKQGSIQRLLNEYEIIVDNLFKKTSNRNLYVGKNVELSSGECGVIESTFGKTTKVKVQIPDALEPETLKLLRGKLSSVQVLLKFKKYIFNKDCGLVQ